MRTISSLVLAMLVAANAPAIADDQVPAVALDVPAFSGNAACPVETSHKAPDDFYPPGSQRREESGEVLIEFTAEVGAPHPRDVAIVKGSGFADLDRAALKLGASLEVSTSCGAQRVRRYIVYEMWRDPRDKREFHGCLVYDPATVTVSIFPYDEP